MEYKGIKLTEFKPTENVIFDPPKEMLVWDEGSNECKKANVLAVFPKRAPFPVVEDVHTWNHCAEIPVEAQKLATFREVSRWLSEGKGEVKTDAFIICSKLSYMVEDENKPVLDYFRVRKWGDTEWHKPTREYLGLEDK